MIWIIFYIVGCIIAYLMLRHDTKKLLKRYGINDYPYNNADLMFSLLSWAGVLGVLIGRRL